jgi:ornithine cyclodeaminase
MVGTGALAPHLIRAHAAMRPYQEVRIWGRSLDKAAALAADLRDEGLPTRAAADHGAAARAADVVSCATLSRTPEVQGVWLKPGAHLDLVGGYTPEMRETDDDAIRRADIYIDTRNALAEAGDLADPVRAGLLDPDRVVELSELAAAGPRPRSGDITLFKSVGSAVSDLAAAELFARKAG